jgi:hypothetical protein
MNQNAPSHAWPPIKPHLSRNQIINQMPETFGRVVNPLGPWELWLLTTHELDPATIHAFPRLKKEFGVLQNLREWQPVKPLLPFKKTMLLPFKYLKPLLSLKLLTIFSSSFSFLLYF